jgi:hypothetical protein
METSIPQDQWEDQELDGKMWFRGMHYNCWGQEDGGEELHIEMNGGVLWGRPRPGRGCRAIGGWMEILQLLIKSPFFWRYSQELL